MQKSEKKNKMFTSKLRTGLLAFLMAFSTVSPAPVFAEGDNFAEEPPVNETGTSESETTSSDDEVFVEAPEQSPKTEHNDGDGVPVNSEDSNYEVTYEEETASPEPVPEYETEELEEPEVIWELPEKEESEDADQQEGEITYFYPLDTSYYEIGYKDSTSEIINGFLPDTIKAIVDGEDHYIDVIKWEGHEYVEQTHGSFDFHPVLDDEFVLAEDAVLPIVTVKSIMTVEDLVKEAKITADAEDYHSELVFSAKGSKMPAMYTGGSANLDFARTPITLDQLLTYKPTANLTDDDKLSMTQQNYREASDNTASSYLYKSAEWLDRDNGIAEINIFASEVIDPPYDAGHALFVFTTCPSHGFRADVAVWKVKYLFEEAHYNKVTIMMTDGPDRITDPIEVSNNPSDPNYYVSVIQSADWRGGNHYNLNVLAGLYKYFFGSYESTTRIENRKPSLVMVQFDELYEPCNYAAVPAAGLSAVTGSHACDTKLPGREDEQWDSNGHLYTQGHVADPNSGLWDILKEYEENGRYASYALDGSTAVRGRISRWGYASEGTFDSDIYRTNIIAALAQPHVYDAATITTTPLLRDVATWSNELDQSLLPPDAARVWHHIFALPSDYMPDYSEINDYYDTDNQNYPLNMVIKDVVSDDFEVTEVTANQNAEIIYDIDNEDYIYTGERNENDITAVFYEYESGDVAHLTITARSLSGKLPDWTDTNNGNATSGMKVDGSDTYHVIESPKLSKDEHTLTINYLRIVDANEDDIEDTPEDLTDNTVLYTQYFQDHLKTGDTYSVVSPDLEDGTLVLVPDGNGYRLVDSAQATVKGTMPNHDVVINVYYNPHMLIINYLKINDANGDEIEDTPDDISDNVVLYTQYQDITKGKGDNYSVTSPDLEDGTRVLNPDGNGYRLVDPDDAVVAGVMPKNIYEYNVYYQPHMLTIHYKEAVTDVPLAQDYVDPTKGRGDNFSVPSHRISGYTLVNEAQATVIGTMPANIHEITVYYEKDPMVGSQVTVYKSANPVHQSKVAPGDTITYTLKAINTGVNSSGKVYISDIVPEGMTYVSAANGGTLDGNRVSWVINSVGVDQEVSVSWVAKVNDDNTDELIYNNGLYHNEGETIERETNEIIHFLDDTLRGPAALLTVKGSGLATSTVTKYRREYTTESYQEIVGYEQKPVYSTYPAGSTSFGYSGAVQEWTAPYNTTYTLTVIGAGGGSIPKSQSDPDRNRKLNGGHGGSATGQVTLQAGTKLYVAVGNKGTSGRGGAGGWNGGGKGSNRNATHAGAGGGGATSITTTNRGTLNNFENYKNEVVIVAGGGGGAGTNLGEGDTAYSWDAAGNIGKGGGLSGGPSGHGPTHSAGQASQTGGNAFGNGYAGSTSQTGGGGGGGWYGGPVYHWNNADCGGGGSAYIQTATTLSHFGITPAVALSNASTTLGGGSATDTAGSATISWSAGTYISGYEDDLTKPIYETRYRTTYRDIPYQEVVSSDSSRILENFDPATSEITYTLSIQNNGFATSHGTVLIDPIPEGTTYVSDSADNGGTYNSASNRLEWWVGDLEMGQSKEYTFKVKVNAGTSLIQNQAEFGRDFEQSQLSTAVPKHASNIVEHLIPGSITVYKEWVDDEGLTRPNEVSITLKGSDNSTRTGAATAANGWKATFTGLAQNANVLGAQADMGNWRLKGNDFSSQAAVEVTQHSVIDNQITFHTQSGWEKAMSNAIPVVNGHSYVLDFDYQTLTAFTNASGGAFGLSVTNEDEMATAGSTAANEKAKKNFTTTVMANPEHVRLTFTANANNVYLVMNGGYLADGNNYSFKISNLSLTDTNQTTYKAWETTVLPGYTSSASSEATAVQVNTSTGIATITNTPTRYPMTITKLWDGDDAANRPVSVTFHIKGSDGSSYTKMLSAPNWTDTFNVQYMAGETPITYKVWEEPVGKYISSNTTEATAVTAVYDENAHAYSASITNTLSTGVITLNKAWAEDTPEDRPSSVTFHVIGSDGSSTDVELTAAGGWTKEIEVPIKTATGEDITYTVYEDGVTGYLSSALQANAVTAEFTTGRANVTITNSHSVGEIELSKEWDDGGDIASRPSSVEYILVGSDGSTIHATLTAAENWHKVVVVPRKSPDGADLTYTVYETSVIGGYHTETADAEHGIVVTPATSYSEGYWIINHDDGYPVSKAGLYNTPGVQIGVDTTKLSADNAQILSLPDKFVYKDKTNLYTSSNVAQHTNVAAYCYNGPLTAGYNNLSGELKLVFKDAAIRYDGKRYDLVLTLSNIIIRAKKTQTKEIGVLAIDSNVLFLTGYGTTKGTQGDAMMFGMDVTVKTEITDDNGNIVSGNILMEFRDIDQPDRFVSPPSYGANATTVSAYQEAVEPMTGVTSKIYMESNTKVKYNFNSATQTATRFGGTSSDEGSNRSAIHYTAKAASSSFRWTGSGCATGITYLGYYLTPPNHSVVITNAREKAPLTISKVWAEDSEADRPTSVIFHIKGSDGLQAVKTLTAPDWSDTFDVNKTDLDNNLVTYYVWEDLPEGYESNAVSEATAVAATYDATANAFTASITNTIEAKDYPVVKNVYNDDEEDINEEIVFDGDTLHYVISVTNPMSTTRKFDMEDTIPVNSTYIENSANLDATYDASAKKLTWTGVEIEAGATKEFKFNVTAVGKTGEWTEVHNYADVWMQKSSGVRNERMKKRSNEVVNYLVDRFPSESNTSHKTVTDAAGVDINTKYVEKNDILYYHVSVRNDSPVAKEFTITDTIPANTEFVQAYDGGTFGSNKVTWVKTIPARGSVEVSFTVRALLDSSDIVNVAHVAVDHVEWDTNEVENQTAMITINKALSNYHESYGQPSFIYKIVGTDGSVAYRMIEITNQRNGTATFTVPRYTPNDTAYTVEELRNARYEFDSVATTTADTTTVTANNPKANVAFAKTKRASVLNYTNTINDWMKATHADSVTNNIGE